MELSSFQCSQCGLCCKQIGKVPQMSSLDRGDGTCRHLENNLCRIYSTRPIFCKVEEMYEMFSDMYDLETFYELNYEICRKLQQDEEARVNAI